MPSNSHPYHLWWLVATSSPVGGWPSPSFPAPTSMACTVQGMRRRGPRPHPWAVVWRRVTTRAPLPRKVKLVQCLWCRRTWRMGMQADREGTQKRKSEMGEQGPEGRCIPPQTRSATYYAVHTGCSEGACPSPSRSTTHPRCRRCCRIPYETSPINGLALGSRGNSPSYHAIIHACSWCIPRQIE